MARLDALITEAYAELKAFAEGRTVWAPYLCNLRDQMQYCLVDIGDLAKEELREIGALEISISEGLQQRNNKGVYGESQLKEGDDASEFLRLQQEYDRETPPKIRRMILLLQQVRDKMLGVAPPPASLSPQQAVSPEVGPSDVEAPSKPVAGGSRKRTGPKADMVKHRKIAEVVTAFGENWKHQLAEIALKLDSENIPTSEAWKQWCPPARTWDRAVTTWPDNVRQAIEYSLKMARRTEK